MSHSFSRFGRPSARERFHQKGRPSGSLAMFLPTVLATLFLFTVVIALNKATSMSNAKIIRLINVDDVYPTPEAVETNRTKAFWEMPPPPSPDAVLAELPAQAPPVLVEESAPVESGPLRFAPAPPAPARRLTIGTGAISPPAVAPDTSLPTPVATPTP
jgi:hypothetical protein